MRSCKAVCQSLTEAALPKIDRSETIEITILNINSKQYKFGDVDTTLNKVVLHGISLHTDALTKSYSGKTVLPTAAMLMPRSFAFARSIFTFTTG